MDQKTLPRPRLAPLPPDHAPELIDMFADYAKRGSYIPNSMLIMQRKPHASALRLHSRSSIPGRGRFDSSKPRIRMQPFGRLPILHGAPGGSSSLALAKKFNAVWDYQTSSLYSDAECRARCCSCAGCVPNAVSDDVRRTKEALEQGRLSRS
jgi:hypothetical protein